MKKHLFLSTVIFFYFITIFSQESEKPSFLRNQIGIQLNPYINEQFFDFRNINIVSALRYGYRISENITTGLELSSNFPINIGSGQSIHYFSYNVGIITRYSFLFNKRYQLFIEASPYYSHTSGKGINAPDFTNSQFGFYIAPGASLYSKNQKLSLDLYYKFSNLRFINGNRSVLSYKLNYNF